METESHNPIVDYFPIRAHHFAFNDSLIDFIDFSTCKVSYLLIFIFICLADQLVSIVSNTFFIVIYFFIIIYLIINFFSK